MFNISFTVWYLVFCMNGGCVIIPKQYTTVETCKEAGKVGGFATHFACIPYTHKDTLDDKGN